MASTVVEMTQVVLVAVAEVCVHLHRQTLLLNSIATVEHKLQLRRFLIYKVMVPGVIPPVFRVKITPYHLELVVEHRTLLADSQVF
ncbi:hypothetical protein CA952_12730 [Raoultella ornithinolytica]|nr:hypothetical protein CA210_21185 [Raoultella ornithinolytica]OZV31883.1 hypothetical protein CA954_18650 [Raoultella ornithinolytica]OZV33534.1 hypothetical protein CA952_12730 [Raoultella ornithinolytica]OZV34980.1 hypothetical protein CA956_10120 [Raoultella ornithinolytica]OZV43500.1 hypothetical protein CA955_23150 [Raoultella ornithinolytica]